MTITEIKHLNVRISIFEDPVFDKKILPIFTTPLILKEVEARQKSKYKIETLNPENKLNFKEVPFNKIVEVLAARINKIAISLEPHYFIDPTYPNSLPYKVRQNLDIKKLDDENREIEEAIGRINYSSLKGKGKKLILPARYTRAGWKPLYQTKDILKHRSGAIINFKKSTLENFKLKQGPVSRHLRNYDRISKNLLLAGWIPTSKGALMLLNDEGWDLDLLLAKNKISQRLRRRRPYKLRKLRRLRRLRRIRLMTINHYNHRSNNIEGAWAQKDQDCQERNHSKIIYNYNKNSNNVLNNKYLIKHNDNKLKFIVNWIGDNLSYTYFSPYQKKKQTKNLRLSSPNKKEKKKVLQLNSLPYSGSFPISPAMLTQLSQGGGRTGGEKSSALRSANGRADGETKGVPTLSPLSVLPAHTGVEMKKGRNIVVAANTLVQTSYDSWTNANNQDNKATTQRLNKKNISDIFLVRYSKPKDLPILEVLEQLSQESEATETDKQNNNSAENYVVAVQPNAAEISAKGKGSTTKNSGFQTDSSKSAINYALPHGERSVGESYRGGASAAKKGKESILPLLSPAEIKQLMHGGPNSYGEWGGNKASQGKSSKQNNKKYNLTSKTKAQNHQHSANLARGESRKFSTLATSITTISNIGNYDRSSIAACVELKVLTQYRAASNAAPNSLETSKNKKKKAQTKKSSSDSFSTTNLRGDSDVSNPNKGVSLIDKSSDKKNNKKLKASAPKKAQASNMEAPLSTGSLLSLSVGRTGAKLRKRLRTKEIKIWKKKKKVSEIKLGKIGLNYANSQKVREKFYLTFDENEKLVPSVSTTAKNSLRWDVKFAAELKLRGETQLLQDKTINKIKSSAVVEPRKRISSLLNSSAIAADPKLFWSIIKLYSSSFNPMLNSLNKTNLALPGLWGIGTAAQLKILKINNDNLTPHPEENGINAQLPHGTIQSPKTLPLFSLQRRERFAARASQKVPSSAAQIIRGDKKSRKRGWGFVIAEPNGGGEKATAGRLPNNLGVRSKWRSVPLKAGKNFSFNPAVKLGRAEQIFAKLSSSLITPLLCANAATGKGAHSSTNSKLKISEVNRSSKAGVIDKKSSRHSTGLAMGPLRVKKILPLKFNQFDPQIKKKVINFLQPEDTVNVPFVNKANHARKDLRLTGSKLPELRSVIEDRRKGNASKPVLTPAKTQKDKKGRIQHPWFEGKGGYDHKKDSSSSRRGAVGLNNYYSLWYQNSRWKGRRGQAALAKWRQSIRVADKKKFLFLYFIVPIFFATLKNSTPTAQVRSAGQLKKLKNSQKQLRSLIKLMLALPKPDRTGGLRNTRRRHLSQNSPKLKGGLAKNMNYLIQSLNLNIRKTLTKTLKTKSKAGTRNANSTSSIANAGMIDTAGVSVPAGVIKNTLGANAKGGVGTGGARQVNFASVVLLDLLKWSVLFIAQSLSPLKRKHDYYSLIFFKILETKGFLDLNLITESDPLRGDMIRDRSLALRTVEGAANAKPAALIHSTETLPLQTSIIPLHSSHSSLPKASVDGEKDEVSGQSGKSSRSGQFGQSGQSGSVKPKPLDISEEAAKKATITFYSGGRFISDWKRVSKVIWQEEYKFNAVYRRVQNSLYLSNLSLNRKLRNWYAIITIFKFWDIIKIITFKSVYSFKLQVLYLKYPTFWSARISRIRHMTEFKPWYAIAPLLHGRSCVSTQLVGEQTRVYNPKGAALTGGSNKAEWTRIKTTIHNKGCPAAVRPKVLYSINKKTKKKNKKKNKNKRNKAIAGRPLLLLTSPKANLADPMAPMTQMAPPVLTTPHSSVIERTANRSTGALHHATASLGTKGSALEVEEESVSVKKLKKNYAEVILRNKELFKANIIQVNFIDNLKHPILNSILKTLEVLPLIKWQETLTHDNINKVLLENRPINAPLRPGLTTRHLNVPRGKAPALKEKTELGGGFYTQKFSFSNKLPLSLKLILSKLRRGIATPKIFSSNLTRLIQYMDFYIPYNFTVHRLNGHWLVPFKNLGFISKKISLPLSLHTDKIFNKHLVVIKAIINKHRSTVLPVLPVVRSLSLKNNLTGKAVHQYAASIAPNIEFKKSFNNLVYAKSTIIGKIRSIKLVESIDKIKEEIIIEEKLKALVRVADITELNFINKKQNRRINASKYLNKKNIYRANRIKILQTIESIKTDFRFEPKLDSNSLSISPVSLLFYSNLSKLPYPITAGADKRLDLHPLLGGADLAKATQRRTGGSVSTTDERSPVISAFLRELSNYNRETKGIINSFQKIVGYNFNTNTNKISSTIFELLEASFKAMNCIISKPVFVITPDKITIQFFYFVRVANKKQLKRVRKKFKYQYYNRTRIRKIYTKKKLKQAKKFNLNNLTVLFNNLLKFLTFKLNKVYHKPIEFNLIRLHYPSGESNILGNLVGSIINSTKISRINKKLFNGLIIKRLTKYKKHKKNNITIFPAFLTGLKFQVSGRVMTQKIKPRKTKYLSQRGATARGKINLLNFARLTKKNRRGSYSITIVAGQNYFK